MKWEEGLLVYYRRRDLCWVAEHALGRAYNDKALVSPWQWQALNVERALLAEWVEQVADDAERNLTPAQLEVFDALIRDWHGCPDDLLPAARALA